MASSAAVPMPAPVCLIKNQGRRLAVCPEALQLLAQIRQPVVVVAIVGLYRTGKSYLMNRLAGRNSGFPLGSAVQASTKGIWMWCVPYPERPDRTLVLLDTEGLGDVEKGDTQNDSWIFALAVLLSSTLVYNSIGTIDQNAMDQLHYVTELTERIKAKASPSGSDGGGLEDAAEYVRFFPSFIWALRDFTLQLKLNGRSITEDEYLEHSLKLKKGDTHDVQLFNLPRKCIRFFFPTRKCFVFGRPTSGKNLHRLEQMKESELEPEFVETAIQFCRYVYWTSKEKTIPGGHVVTGRLLAKLVEMYVDTIRSGEVPSVESAVLALAEIENTAAVAEAAARYAELMEEKLRLPTETVPELLGIHAECEKEAVRVFMGRAFKDDKRHFQLKLMKTLEEKKEEYCRRNELESSRRCQAVLALLSGELEENVRKAAYSRPSGHKHFVDDLKKIEEKYYQEPKKGVMAEAVLQQFLKDKESISRAILQSDEALTEKEKEMAEAKAQAEAAQREQEVQRQRQNELEQKLQDQRRSFEMNMQQLKEKMERERGQLLEEHNKMLESKLAAGLGGPQAMASSAAVPMPAPVCLIKNQGRRLAVCPEALQLLAQIRQPVVVVAIVGLYRTGKSYLMNRLAGRNSGFPLGSAVQASTKGIWMWCVPYPERPDRTLVLLDTEGLGDVEKGDTQNDSWIFALAVLLSSTLVYNSIGTIDQNAMDQLHYVTELTERIKAKASPSGSDGGGLEDAAEYVRFFPSFIWALRDFTLQLKLNGRSITEDEYLEHSLKLKKGDTHDVQLFNLPRKCIRFFFPTRKCFVFDRPTSGKNLHRLEQMKESELEPEFVETDIQFCRYVYWTSKEKTIPGGHVVTGRLLAKLVEMYVDTIRSGEVPSVESAVLALAEIENTAAVAEAAARYAELMEEKLRLPTETVPELLGIHVECEKEAVRVFMGRAFKDDKRRFQLKLMKTLEEKKEEYCRRNELESSRRCQAVLALLSGELEENVRKAAYSRPSGHKHFVDDLKKIEEKYYQEPKKGVMAEAVLQQFLKDKESISRAILQSDEALTEKEKEMAEAKAQAEAAQREQEVQRQRQNELEQKLQDQRRSFEMNMQQLKEKMERERGQLLEEHNKMLESKLAEQQALLTERFQKEARCLRNEIEHLRRESENVQKPSWMSTILDGLLDAASLFLPGIAGKAVGVLSNLIRRL